MRGELKDTAISRIVRISWHAICAFVAQLAEQLICNQQVIGSSPIRSFGQFWPYQIGELGARVQDTCLKYSPRKPETKIGTKTNAPPTVANPFDQFWPHIAGYCSRTQASLISWRTGVRIPLPQSGTRCGFQQTGSFPGSSDETGQPQMACPERLVSSAHETPGPVLEHSSAGRASGC